MDNALLGVIVGGLIAFGGQNFVELIKTRRDQHKSEALVRAYLIGLLDITEHRGHVELAQRVVAQWKAGNDIEFAFFGSESLNNDLIEAGELSKQTSFLRKDDAAALARFISAMQAIRINMAMLSNPAFKKQPIERRIAHVEWTLQQWFRAKDIAQALIDQL